MISPNGSWPFGKTLRASDVYEAILAEPGVRYAEQLSFAIDEGPGGGRYRSRARPQPAAQLYAAAGGRLYRTLDSAESWTTILADAGADVTARSAPMPSSRAS